MPEASINEHGNLERWECKIGFPKDGKVAAPSNYVVLAEETDDRHLGMFVPTASNAGHHFRSLAL